MPRSPLTLLPALLSFSVLLCCHVGGAAAKHAAAHPDSLLGCLERQGIRTLIGADVSYYKSRQVFSKLFEDWPAAIAYPNGTADVAAAVRCAVPQQVARLRFGAATVPKPRHSRVVSTLSLPWPWEVFSDDNSIDGSSGAAPRGQVGPPPLLPQLPPPPQQPTVCDVISELQCFEQDVTTSLAGVETRLSAIEGRLKSSVNFSTVAGRLAKGIMRVCTFLIILAKGVFAVGMLIAMLWR
ncbi:hypothetical protein D9Q98_005817 [Chlorella vulgaris]|uniref:Uncharacterized protein n=1 Tax=Chlorella vulgaris TaxID=3077 RepID=A0A9D4TWW4_CHLVU|nr:hypothetical protein D9Q98_005817 [Chlorella vulgaris]